jgi:hypothetical protein
MPVRPLVVRAVGCVKVYVALLHQPTKAFSRTNVPRLAVDPSNRGLRLRPDDDTGAIGAHGAHYPLVQR